MDVTTSKSICFLLCLFVYNKLEIDVRICFPMFRWFNTFWWRVSEYFILWRPGTATKLIYSVNSFDPETATFILHKAIKIKCCLFLQENPAVARENALQPI